MKVLAWIVGLVLLLIVGLGVYLVMNSGALLERAMETYGTRYLGAPVEVGGVDVSLAEGSVRIADLEIGNPAGFSGPPAFRLASIEVALNSEETTGELVVLDRVLVDGADVTALVKGRDSNLQKLMDNLNAQLGAEEEVPPEDEEAMKLIIDRFSFTGAHASVNSDVLGAAEVDIPDIMLEGIGRKTNGATVGEALKQVLEPVIRAVTRAMAERGIDVQGAREAAEKRLRDKASEKLGRGLDALRGTLGGQEEPR